MSDSSVASYIASHLCILHNLKNFLLAWFTKVEAIMILTIFINSNKYIVNYFILLSKVQLHLIFLLRQSEKKMMMTSQTTQCATREMYILTIVQIPIPIVYLFRIIMCNISIFKLTQHSCQTMWVISYEKNWTIT